MTSIIIIVVALIVLGASAYAVAQWPEAGQDKKKKDKKERPAPVEMPKEVSEVTERFERRVRSLENALQAAQADQKERLARIDELKAVIAGLEQQVGQEKAWREKEEASSAKERKQEHELRADLERTRASLHEESNQRIKLEYELKEVKLLKDAVSSDVRKLTGQNNELDRQLKELNIEARALRSENAKLKVKKEADQWVAKDEYVMLEKFLKRAQKEIEELKKKSGA
jgi:chromosome segregation ATPase